MNVKIKDMSVNMNIGNNGVEFDISDNKQGHIGDLYITKSGLTWCAGKTSKEKGACIKWKQFIEMINKNK